MKQIKIISGTHKGKTARILTCFWQLNICVVEINGRQYELSLCEVEDISYVKKAKFMEQMHIDLYYGGSKRNYYNG